jgi:hypothetical protein
MEVTASQLSPFHVMNKNKIYGRLMILMARLMEIHVFWDVMLYCKASGCQRFLKKTHCYLQGLVEYVPKNIKFHCAGHTSNSSALHNQTAYRFGHQKAVLTNVFLRMGIIMLETC